jgi:hypothetical protein
MQMLRTVALGAMIVFGSHLSAHAATTTAKPTAFPGASARPNVRGDQVIFYYDARDGFTTFINIRNEAATELRVQLDFYGPSFTTPFTQVVTLPATRGTNAVPGLGGLAVLDVGDLRGSGLAATPGVAFATVVNDMGQPVVSRGLSGNFTVANIATGSAWGSPGAARSAIHPPTPGADACAPKSPSPTLGSVIDGTTVLLAPIQPSNADLSAYYDPATLAPAALGGNQLIFVSFVDVPGATFTAAAAATHWTFTPVRNTGEGLAPGFFNVSGLTVSDLASVVGPGVTGSSGAILFNADPSPAQLTRLIYFSETVGTFSTGYLLPRR